MTIDDDLFKKCIVCSKWISLYSELPYCRNKCKKIVLNRLKEERRIEKEKEKIGRNRAIS